jgi:hypothetical protein
MHVRMRAWRITAIALVMHVRMRAWRITAIALVVITTLVLRLWAANTTIAELNKEIERQRREIETQRKEIETQRKEIERQRRETERLEKEIRRLTPATIGIYNPSQKCGRALILSVAHNRQKEYIEQEKRYAKSAFEQLGFKVSIPVHSTGLTKEVILNEIKVWRDQKDWSDYASSLVFISAHGAAANPEEYGKMYGKRVGMTIIGCDPNPAKPGEPTRLFLKDIYRELSPAYPSGRAMRSQLRGKPKFWIVSACRVGMAPPVGLTAKVGDMEAKEEERADSIHLMPEHDNHFTYATTLGHFDYEDVFCKHLHGLIKDCGPDLARRSPWDQLMEAVNTRVQEAPRSGTPKNYSLHIENFLRASRDLQAPSVSCASLTK